MKRQVHPGWGMHITTSFLMLYYGLDVLTTYCSMELWSLAAAAVSTTTSNSNGGNGEFTTGETLKGPKLKLKQTKEQALMERKPIPPPKGLPPRITKDLLLENITALWSKDSNERILRCNSTTTTTRISNSSSIIRCPFGWIYGIGHYQTKDQIQKLSLPYFVNQKYPDDWEMTDGWIPKNTSTDRPTMVMEFPSFDDGPPITTITIFILKSNAEPYQNSTIQVTVQSLADPSKLPNELAQSTISGYHTFPLDEKIPNEINLFPSLPNSGLLRLEIRLVGGSTFKIKGMALCRDHQ